MPFPGWGNWSGGREDKADCYVPVHGSLAEVWFTALPQWQQMDVCTFCHPNVSAFAGEHTGSSPSSLPSTGACVLLFHCRGVSWDVTSSYLLWETTVTLLGSPREIEPSCSPAGLPSAFHLYLPPCFPGPRTAAEPLPRKVASSGPGLS